ncbi:MAG: hypothetical protein AB7G13_12735 [Lautropia sp.]
MIAIGKRDCGVMRRRRLELEDGTPYHKGEWMESGQDADLSPLMFLVEQGPHSTLPSHFHRQNEFQLVVEGSGTFGSHAVDRYALHYAGAYTGYGPIVAGAAGLSYFTIRAVFETGGYMLPASRSEMIPGPKRQVFCTPFDAASTAALSGLDSATRIDLVADQPDRLAAQRILIPPHGKGVALDGRGTSGVFNVVLSGRITCDGAEIGLLESIFASADETPSVFTACDAGAEVISLRIPIKVAPYL